MRDNILREITPLTQADCFTIFSRKKKDFDFPLHYHEEIELNLILNGPGAKRVIGDHIEEIGDLELVLVGPNLQHAWFGDGFKEGQVTEVTIQFHRDFFDDKFLRKNQLSFIRNMLEKSSRGILFSPSTTRELAPRILGLGKKQGFDSVLELMSILHDLSISRNYKVLSDSTFNNIEKNTYNSRRIEKVMAYTHQSFQKQISLAEVSKLTNMTESAFSRFFKLRTGMTFIDSLTDIRLGHASRLLIETTQSISEIAYDCGFNNISNFNRIFRKKKGCTPKELRESYEHGARVFI
ncbi:MAG TPA: AraC family transcriptional regulator [Bacteroidales bacterium]|jgi:AraC-like DNA-binding protein/mannose-6-phosphate isomerase-like protein (cupin superfamily)|nr:AraC family transcriptional regulator [Bacteroidales bacterium]